MLRNALNIADVKEKNRCVLMHLAFGIEWMCQGRPKSVPDKSRVSFLANQLRMDEYQQALSFCKRITTPRTETEYDLRSLSHDVMTPGHDRNFRALDWFLSEGTRTTQDLCVRIIDIVKNEDQYGDVVYEYSNTAEDVPMDQCVVLGVWNQQMRFLKPTPETATSQWRGLGSNFKKKQSPNADGLAGRTRF